MADQDASRDAERFTFEVEYVGHITGRGTVVWGVRRAGILCLGDVLAVLGREDGRLAACTSFDPGRHTDRTLEDGLFRSALIVPAWTKDDVAVGDLLVVVRRAPR